ncbi:MAG: hypothetical protein GWN67_09910 [Phycisphaerae bacterium]|nr:hypothetical protein [Phycisphaerae bacterium]NIP52410.1 hypothetical protein [Phycisphaerae bacterium]NIS51403.1 hypothetical protein [Phycisphaerae bacterium]NIU09018.1 hypothetical protein [Phycisphaerae bacterium]NIU56678.1 hypothetical protein [Phycisphaerae bacterium]
MANDNEKQKADLDKLGRLVDKYAQSRSLPLLISLAMMIFNVVLVLSVVKLVVAYGMRIGQSGALIIVILVFLWIIFSPIWVVGKLLARYGGCFYKREGFIKLQRERIPLSAFIAFVITFLGPVFLNIFWIMPARWSLTISLTSLGIFMLYAGKKDKKITLGFVYGILSLAEAAVTAMGVRIPFINEHSCFIPLVIYMVGAGLITTVVVHIYNPRILHKIKEVRPFGELQANKPDS